jgi:hydroxyacylglutathione hydrolase
MRIETFTLGELQENAYLVVAEEGRDDESGVGAVIDPGDYPARLIDRIQETGVVLCAILLTHGHWDHVNGVRDVKAAFGAPIYLHGADAPLYDHAAEHAELLGFHADPQPPLDHHLSDGDVLEFGPLRFEVLHTPGHTPGGVCYRLAGADFGELSRGDNGRDVVFVGDTIFAGGVGRTDLPGGSFEQLVDGIRQKLLSLDDNTTLFPGHGPPTTVGTERRSNPFLQ